MTSKKQLKIAKQMFKDSLAEGPEGEARRVDAKKVTENLKSIISQRTARLTSILRAYKRLIEEALKKEEALVESAVSIPNQSQFEKNLKTKLNVLRVRYQINPRVVIGARVTHGDWVYDATLDAKLKQLTT